jgi:hypothetical protein
MGLTTRLLLLSDSCGFVPGGGSLWLEDGSVVYNCSWPSPAQSFSGTSPVRLGTIFYCLGLFVASYESQGHGGGIRHRLHTGNTLNWFCPLLKKSQCEPRRNTPFPILIIVACVFVATRTCLQSRCPETIVVTESPLSNGSIRRKIHVFSRVGGVRVTNNGF